MATEMDSHRQPSGDNRHRRNVSADSGLSVSFSSSKMSENFSSQDSDAAENAMMDLSQESQEDSREGDHAEGTEPRPKLGAARSSDSGVALLTSASMEVEEAAESLTSQTSKVLKKCSSLDDPEMDTLTHCGEDSPDFPESIASQAVRCVYSTLIEAIPNQVSILKLSADLYTFNLIEHTVHNTVQTSNDSDDKKMTKILDAVLSRMRVSGHDVHPFDCFVKVLESYPTCCQIAAQIRSRYDELKRSHEAVHRPNGHGDSSEMVCGAHARGMQYSTLKQNHSEEPFHIAETAHYLHKSLQRQRSMSGGNESDGAVSMTREEIEEELRRLHQGSKRLKKGIQKYFSKETGAQCIVKETLRRTEVEVEELQREVQECYREVQQCKEQKQIIEEQLEIARRQVRQLNEEVLRLKKQANNSKQPCFGSCEHRVECEKLTKRIKRMEDEKLDLIARIETLTQQRDLLLT